MQQKQDGQQSKSLTAADVNNYFAAMSAVLDEVLAVLENPKYTGQLTLEQAPMLQHMFTQLGGRLEKASEFNREIKAYFEAALPDDIEVDVTAFTEHVNTTQDKALKRLMDYQRQVDRLNKEVERKRTSISARTQPKPPQPPLNALLLLYLFLEKNGREEAVGDALEDYSRHVKRLGKLRADILFCQEVVRCAWPFIKRLVTRGGGLILLSEWIRRMTH